MIDFQGADGVPDVARIASFLILEVTGGVVLLWQMIGIYNGLRLGGSFRDARRRAMRWAIVLPIAAGLLYLVTVGALGQMGLSVTSGFVWEAVVLYSLMLFTSIGLLGLGLLGGVTGPGFRRPRGQLRKIGE